MSASAQAAAPSRASSTNRRKPSGSLTAISASILRFTSTPASLEAVDQLRVAHALLARGGVDPRDPEAPEVALAVAPVAVGVGVRAHDLLVREAVARVLAPVVALGAVEDLLAPLAAGDGVGCARHQRPPSRQQPVDPLRVGLGDLGGTAEVPLPLRATSSRGCGCGSRACRAACRWRSCGSASSSLNGSSSSASRPPIEADAAPAVARPLPSGRRVPWRPASAPRRGEQHVHVAALLQGRLTRSSQLRDVLEEAVQQHPAALGVGCSRPRNMIVTLTLSCCFRKRSTWPFLVS